MITEKERKYRDELFKLMLENPDLPVVPMVDADIVGDDYARWMGSWGSARIDEYLLPRNEYSHVMYKSDNDVGGVVENYLTYAEYETLPAGEEAFQQAYDALPWTKAIVVNIDLPD